MVHVRPLDTLRWSADASEVTYGAVASAQVQLCVGLLSILTCRALLMNMRVMPEMARVHIGFVTAGARNRDPAELDREHEDEDAKKAGAHGERSIWACVPPQVRWFCMTAGKLSLSATIVVLRRLDRTGAARSYLRAPYGC